MTRRTDFTAHHLRFEVEALTPLLLPAHAGPSIRIEEFRAPVVDRTVFGLANKRVPLEQDERGLLIQETRRTLAEKVLARLESPARYERKRHPLRAIIQMQARHVATFVRGDRAAYKPFVAKW